MLLNGGVFSRLQHPPLISHLKHKVIVSNASMSNLITCFSPLNHIFVCKCDYKKKKSCCEFIKKLQKETLWTSMVSTAYEVGISWWHFKCFFKYIQMLLLGWIQITVSEKKALLHYKTHLHLYIIVKCSTGILLQSSHQPSPREGEYYPHSADVGLHNVQREWVALWPCELPPYSSCENCKILCIVPHTRISVVQSCDPPPYAPDWQHESPKVVTFTNGWRLMRVAFQYPTRAGRQCQGQFGGGLGWGINWRKGAGGKQSQWQLCTPSSYPPVLIPKCSLGLLGLTPAQGDPLAARWSLWRIKENLYFSVWLPANSMHHRVRCGRLGWWGVWHGTPNPDPLSEADLLARISVEQARDITGTVLPWLPGQEDKCPFTPRSSPAAEKSLSDAVDAILESLHYCTGLCVGLSCRRV